MKTTINQPLLNRLASTLGEFQPRSAAGESLIFDIVQGHPLENHDLLHDIHHEAADGDPGVIYTHRARALVHSASAQEQEEALSMVEETCRSIQGHCEPRPEVLAYWIVLARQRESFREDLREIRALLEALAETVDGAALAGILEGLEKLEEDA